MVLYINIPNDIKQIIKNSKGHYKDSNINIMNNNINYIYKNVVDNIYKSQSFKVGDHNYTQIEDMYGAMSVFENNGEKISIFLNEDSFDTTQNFNSNMMLENIFQENSTNNYIYNEENFLELQIKFKNEIDDFLKNKFLRILNKTRR